jgi:plasmid stabilization system protein ParE
MRNYRLSLQAEQRLEDIVGWTIDHFGPAQAAKYKGQLIARLTSLAAKETLQGRSCNILLNGKRDASDIEYYREGRHYIIYRNTNEGIFVLDFVHGSRDLQDIVQHLLKYN